MLPFITSRLLEKYDWRSWVLGDIFTTSSKHIIYKYVRDEFVVNKRRVPFTETLPKYF